MRICPWIFLSVVLFAGRCRGAETAPEFVAKLKPIPPFPALQSAARSKGIPLQGIERPVPTNVFSPGDSATMLVTLHAARHPLTQWLIYFQAAANPKGPPPKSGPPTVFYTSTGRKFEFAHSWAIIRVRTVGPVIQPDSRQEQPMLKDQSARITVNKNFLGLGLDGATAALRQMNQLRQHKKGAAHSRFSVSSKPFKTSQIARGRQMAASLQLTPAEERSLAGAIPAMFSYFNIVQRTPGLDSIMFKVLSMPSLWSIVKNFGISPGFAIGRPRDRVGPLSLPHWNVSPRSPTYALPLEVTLNNHAALTLTMIVTAPHPPFLVSGGIVGFLAENPQDKNDYLTLRLISAHCRVPMSETGPNPMRVHSKAVVIHHEEQQKSFASP